ncbi:MAG: MerR family transcriptional regulator [bacterium]
MGRRAVAKRERPSGIKISRLAELAEISVPTIKHYLKEGLLPRPVKTGRTMSYYDSGCVELVRQIKQLQAQRFLPLSVIRKLILSGKPMGEELALGEALMCLSEASDPGRAVPAGRIEQHTGYPRSQIDRMEACGLICPERTPRGKVYDALDCRIIQLMRQREEAGLPFAYSLEMMGLYRRHIESIVREDAGVFVKRMLKDASAAEAARYIREGDRTLDAFMPLIRAKLGMLNAERILDVLHRIPDRVEESLRFRLVPDPWGPEEPAGAAASGRSPGASRGAGLVGDGARASGTEAGRAEIAAGARLLARGREAEAIEQLRRADPAGPAAELARALEGIARIARAARTPGLLDMLRAGQEALSFFFEVAGRSSAKGDLRTLTAYFRGVGRAILPDLYGTHGEAALDLEELGRAAKSAKLGKSAKNGRGGPPDSPDGGAALLRQELALKACRALAEMHADDRAYASARGVLEALQAAAGGTYYGQWARRFEKSLAAAEKERR